MTMNYRPNTRTQDVLDNDYPLATLTEEARREREEMISKIKTYGKRVERYSDETIQKIWTDIFENNLSDKEVAEEYNCSSKYAWNIRHDRIRKPLLKRIRMEYFQKLNTESNTEEQCDDNQRNQSIEDIDDVNSDHTECTSEPIVTCTEDDCEEVVDDFDIFDTEIDRDHY